MINSNTTKIVWSAYEYEHKPKTKDWFIALWIVAISSVIAATIYNNPLFALVIFLSALTLTLKLHHGPEAKYYEINYAGVRINKTFYPFKALKSFWIEENELPNKILIESKKSLMPLIVIPIEGISSEQIKTYLIKYLEEIEHHEPAFQKFIEEIGF